MDYIFYFVITIAILVFVHELGHFLAAKISGMRADIFSIGFGPRLFGYNKITGFTTGNLPKDFDGEGNTDYRICAIPLGGYVKIAGMIDETFDTKFAKEEPKPYEFRAKPTYKKLFVISAGVMMNLTLTVLIFWGVNFFQGKQVMETTTVGTVQEESLAAQAGFQEGDKILSVNGENVGDWEGVLNKLFIENLGNNVTVTVERSGATEQLDIPKKILTDASQMTGEPFLRFGDTKPYVSQVVENSPAESGGMEARDVILAINNNTVESSQDVINIISSNPDNMIPIKLMRGSDTLLADIKPSMEGKIGIVIADVYTGPVEYRSYGFFGAFKQSFVNVAQYTGLTFSLVGNVATGDVEFGQAFGGPVRIAQFAAESADTGLISFLFFIALLSLSLAIINILPFPVLDGGHLVIIIIEGIRGKELPLKVKLGIQNFGFVILLMLMVFIIYSDIANL